ncbi:gamma-glutamyltransferase [Agrococcus sp. SL85]|uniref:gamma-glutamyltransferase family protein n=1 Tax=Agrococcus sp. SL85 TaxID=2995141 RepID=UPI00226C90C4|nr:gamma-glutamyltransferase [Agrococcus sp. SL85]WAC65684.1 gamma-glutamyltransferase [Agrococcus sp. SL85]
MTDTFQTRPELRGDLGMVSSTHWLASQAGMRQLELGGNAFDAAVAAAFVLQVVEPHQNGPGGDMTGVLSAGPGADPQVLCGQGVAPAAATIDAFEALGLDMVPGTGTTAAAVPGATMALLLLARDRGTASVRGLLEPAAFYARDGYPVTERIAAYIARVAALFREHWPTSAATYLPGGRPPKEGERLRNPALARTYERLIDAADAAPGREAGFDAAMAAWSRGFVAEAVDAFGRIAWMDSSGSPHRGMLTGDDMAGWRPSFEAPVSIRHEGLTVCKPGFWSQGPVFLQQLALLEGLGADPATADGIHAIVEASKLAFADREAWYGDEPGLPHAALLDEARTAERRALLGETASYESRPGTLEGRRPRLPDLVARHEVDPTGLSGVGEPNAVAALLDSGPDATGEARSDTVHVDAVDSTGAMVALMPSGGWLHSSPIIPELGFPLGTRLQMAWLDRDHPNALRPGKRPRTTLSPTLVLDDDVPVLAFGSPGGDQQDQWALHFLLHRIVGGRGLQEAIDMPAFHSTHTPSSFYPHEFQPGVVLIESRAEGSTIASLRARGHRVGVAGPWEIGRMCAVGRDLGTGWLLAGANARGMQGYAVGR